MTATGPIQMRLNTSLWAKPELVQLLEQSDFRGSYRMWRKQKEIINNHIEAESKVLDTTCANGLLLASLLEWRSDVFVPYGFDISAERVKSAQELLPAFSDQFYVHNFCKLPWPVRHADIVIAPWISSRRFIETCLQYSRRKVIFTAYNDKLSDGLDLSVACQEHGIPQARINTRPGIVQIAVLQKI